MRKIHNFAIVFIEREQWVVHMMSKIYIILYKCITIYSQIFQLHSMVKSHSQQRAFASIEIGRRWNKERKNKRRKAKLTIDASILTELHIAITSYNASKLLLFFLLSFGFYVIFATVKTKFLLILFHLVFLWI